jgi:hypothetical protein
MRTLITILIFLFILLILIAPRPINSGQVVAHTFIPAHEEKFLVAGLYGAWWDIKIVPDEWFFTIQNGDNTKTLKVTESTYNQYKDGDWLK